MDEDEQDSCENNYVDVYEVFKLTNGHVALFMVSVKLDTKEVEMEMDSGAAVSVMSKIRFGKTML